MDRGLLLTIFSYRSSRRTARRVELLVAEAGVERAWLSKGRAERYFFREKWEACVQSNWKEKKAKLTASTLAIRVLSIVDDCWYSGSRTSYVFAKPDT